MSNQLSNNSVYECEALQARLVSSWGHLFAPPPAVKGINAGVCFLLTALTPPTLRVRKPVSASGILALTRSPLLFKGRRSAGTKAAPVSGKNWPPSAVCGLWSEGQQVNWHVRVVSRCRGIGEGPGRRCGHVSLQQTPQEREDVQQEASAVLRPAGRPSSGASCFFNSCPVLEIS